MSTSSVRETKVIDGEIVDVTPVQKAIAVVFDNRITRGTKRALVKGGSAIASFIRQYGLALVGLIIGFTVVGFLAYYGVVFASLVASSFVVPGTAGYYFLMGVTMLFLLNLYGLVVNNLRHAFA